MEKITIFFSTENVAKYMGVASTENFVCHYKDYKPDPITLPPYTTLQKILKLSISVLHHVAEGWQHTTAEDVSQSST